MEVYEVGKAPWEIQETPKETEKSESTSESKPLVYEVGKAPWEIQETPKESEIQVQEDYMNVPYTTDSNNTPSIVDYNSPSYIGKNSSWFDDLVSSGADAVEAIYQPIKPAVESVGLTISAVGAGVGEILESPLSLVSQAISGKPITYYRDLKSRLDVERENNDKEIIKSLGGGVVDSSTLGEIALGFAMGNQLKTIVALEGSVQGALGKPGEKLEDAAIGAGVTFVGGKVIHSLVERYAGKDPTLRKMLKTVGMDDKTAQTHYTNYSKVVGKEVDDFTVTDKVNAIAHGSPEAASILFESVATNPANAQMLNSYYRRVTQSLLNNLEDMPYEQSIAVGKEIKKGIKEGYNNITKTLDESNVKVVIDDPMKTAVQAFTKSALNKLDESSATEFSQRVDKLLNDSGSVGDLFEVEKVIRANINKVDKLGTDASLNEAKGLLKTKMQDLLITTLKENKLDNIVESRKLLNSLYTEISNANNKKLVKVLQNVDVKKDDYKKIYDAMKSTEEVSSYNNLIRVLGPNSKAAGNVEEFVLDRLMNKNIDDLDVINLGKLLGDLEDVTFKSTDGKLMNQVISDFNKAFANIKSTEAWMFERMDSGGSKSDFINQLKASVIGRMAYKITQYLPTDSSRRVYVINHLPKYLKDGLVPNTLKPEVKKSLETYKMVFNNINRFLAEELNSIAEKSKSQAEYLRSVQPSAPLLPNNQVPMTATRRGSVAPGVNEEAVKAAKANDVVGKPSSGQSVSSTTNEKQFIPKERELVDTTIEPDDAVPRGVEQPKDVIDVETMPAHTIDTNGEIWDSRGNKWGSVKDLIKAESIPDDLKLPEKVVTPVKNFFDYKRILKENPKAKEISKEINEAPKDKKDKGKTRLARLLEYIRLREEGLSPDEAHKLALKADGSNIDNNGKITLSLATLGTVGYASKSDAAPIDYTIKDGDGVESIAYKNNVSKEEVELSLQGIKVQPGNKISLNTNAYPIDSVNKIPDVVKRVEVDNVKQALEVHKPTKSSGYTIGYGYDSKEKSISKIAKDFEAAKIENHKEKAIMLKKGEKFTITEEQANALSDNAWLGSYRDGMAIGIPLNDFNDNDRIKVMSLLYRGDIVKGGRGYRGALYNLSKKKDISKIDKYIRKNHNVPEYLKTRWNKLNN